MLIHFETSRFAVFIQDYFYSPYVNIQRTTLATDIMMLKFDLSIKYIFYQIYTPPVKLGHKEKSPIVDIR